MRVYKVMLFLAMTGLFFSCKDKGDTVPKEEYDQIYEEYKILQETLDASKDYNLKQAATINKTLGELAQISGKTLTLRTDIEKGTARVTQADRISANIDAIKSRIASLESQKGNNSAFRKIVANLKTIIREKEAEINSLKEIIESQKETIETQTTKIAEQGQQIDRQQEQLQQAVVAQARLLYQAAYEFEQMADEMPDVSRKKNKRKVDNWAVQILNSSLLYYQKSQEYGNDCSQEISRVKRRIAMMRSL